MYDFDKQQIIEPKRQFTGVWLPRELLLDERLTATDKILYAEIASFGKKGCWKRADELQQLCGVGRDGLQSACKRLRETGYIVERRMYGRIVRTLAVYSTVVKSHQQDNPVVHQPEKPVVQEQDNPVVEQQDNPVVHKDNTKDNTIYINSEVSKKLLDLLNEKTKRNFRILPRGYKETLKKFSLEEIGKALDVLVEDDWHSKKINELKSDYLLRASTIDNMLSKRKKQPEGMADLDELMGDGSWMA
jgi:hypothetical protein|nr:MAG TPA: helix-turn-helix domain protein [Caudoviricetes sp.]